MSYCPDCGGKLSGGMCSNCQEELYILTYQDEDVEWEDLSPEFMVAAAGQERVVDKRLRERWARQRRAEANVE